MPSTSAGPAVAAGVGAEGEMNRRFSRSPTASTSTSTSNDGRGRRPSVQNSLGSFLSRLQTPNPYTFDYSSAGRTPLGYRPHPYLPPPPVPSRFILAHPDASPPIFASGSTGNRYDHTTSATRCPCVHPNAISPAGGTCFMDLQTPAKVEMTREDSKGKGKGKAKSTLTTTLLGPALIHLNPRVPSRNRNDPFVTNGREDEGWEYEAAPSEVKATDPEIHGVVNLFLSKPRRVRRVVVSLVAMANLAFSEWTYEAKELDRRDVVLELDGKLLEQGDHHFSFCIIVPASSAPSISSSYGRVFYRIHSRIEYAPPSSAAIDSEHSEHEAEESTKDGARPRNWSRRTSRPRLPRMATKAPLHAPEVEVELIVAPDEHQLELDTILDTSSDSYSEELGPYSVSLHSNLLSVSGLLSCSVNLECPLSRIKLHRISARIIEDATLYSVEALKRKVSEGRIDKDGPEEAGLQKVPTKMRSIFTVQGEPRPSRPPTAAAAPAAEKVRSRTTRPRSDTVASTASSNSSLSSNSPSRSRRASASSDSTDDSTLASSRPFSSPATSPTSFSPSSLRSRFLRLGRTGSLGGLGMPGEAGKGVPEERPCLAELEVGQEWEMTHVARLPMCHLLRPSSHPGSATPFRVKHQIAVDVVYTVVPNDPMAPLPSPRQLRISKNVHIHGCRCLFSNLILPTYAAVGGDASAQGRCACRFSTEELLGSERQSLAYRSILDNAAPPYIQPPSMVDDRERDVKTSGVSAFHEQFEQFEV